MKVSVIGTGYVGLVSGTCFAEIGHHVTCIDIDENKVAMLQNAQSPIYEPGLNDLLDRNIKADRLHFSTGYESCLEADITFLAVGTPSGDDGNADLTYLESAAKSVATHLKDEGVVVIKSTVPVGTGKKIKDLISSHTDKKFYVVNNPEFLKEGSAIEDFMRPDRVIIGSDNDFAVKQMDELYAPLVRQGNPIYHMSNLSAEMTKYAANCFLATKISFINEVANLCDIVGADIEEVRKGISSDVRIGKHFLYPGPGYGGSCFPKDVKALIYTAKENDTLLNIVQAAEDVNDLQKIKMYQKMKKHFEGNLEGKVFAFWGAAFKANTDDVRETAAIYMAEALIKEGAKIRFYDPVASENYLKAMKKYPETEGKIESVSDMYEVMKDCDGLVTMTEWREFRNPDYKKVKELLKSPVVFDARNLFDTERTLEAGLKYYAIGKKI
tara:strand:+ start:135306 stop:136625 length:1320 start_codon:yes stop_codon:yes gene_type:complete